MVIYIFCTTKSLRTPSNLLIVNLAFSDFFMMFTMGPPMIVNSWHETWVLGPLFCQVYGMFGSMWGCASIWNMTMISFDRYHVIAKGLSAKPMTYGGAILRIVFVWAFSGLWTVAPILGWSRYTPEGSLTACGTDYLSQDISAVSYLYAYSVACYFLPLALIVYAYFFIIKVKH
jgi:r-opsin